MRKHRNFLIFYSIWLGGIVLVLTVFDDPQGKTSGTDKEDYAICTVTPPPATYTEDDKGANKKCCTYQQPNTATRLQ